MIDITTLLAKMTPLIDETIRKLSEKKFKPDPIMGPHFSRMNSLMGSAQKRHGFILERAILETLKCYPQFEAWDDPIFSISNLADSLVISSEDRPANLIETTTPYPDKADRTLQIDLMVYDCPNKTLRSYEIKRGNGQHDAGKKRQILRDLLCTQVLLKSYGQKRGLEVESARSHIIFYYGDCSIKKPFSLTKDELDDHFGVSISEAVEQINDLYRTRLFEILSAT
jgi:hypothetical protein